MNAARVSFCVFVVLTLSACAQTLGVQVAVTLPARVPVQVFPSVWVAGGDNEEENYLLDSVAAHLARDPRRQVRRVDAAELEPARQAGQISWLTAVVRISTTFREDSRAYQNVMPMQYCGMYGCNMMTYQTYYGVMPILHGSAVLTVHEGPTARELSRESFAESVDGDSGAGARAEVTQRLAEDVVRAVDLSLGRERFLLQESKIEEGDQAIQLLRQGRWQEALALLERARTRLGGHKQETQARVWHALGVARLLAAQPKLPSDGDFDAAERALRLAHQLAPTELRQNTLDELAAWRKQQAVLIEQRYAADHNFKLTKEVPSGAPPRALPAQLSPLGAPPAQAAPPVQPAAPAQAAPPVQPAPKADSPPAR